ncbi:MAG TPA: hypothetical protein VME86_15935 [Acidobacteriaceae bacterium]|nr:hypothetical protein [Acidobacteriaceae bacterium]
MPVAKYRFRPRSTLWIGIELIVSYSCYADPKVERVRITGVKQFGLILSSEYEIDAFVDTVRRIPCEADADCGEAVRYEFTVKTFTSDVIGLGIGVGKLGTGTAGWTSRATEELAYFDTACACCDDETRPVDRIVSEVHIVASPQSATPWLLGFAALGTALAFSFMNLDQPSLVPKIVVDATGVGALAAVSVAGVRLIAFLRRVTHPEDKIRERLLRG